MLSKLKSLLIFSVLLQFSTVLNAEMNINLESVNIDAQEINFREAIRKTFAHNPALKSFHHRVKAQQGIELQASMAASPELDLAFEDALGTGNYSGASQVQTTFNISWVIEGKVRQGYVDEARAGGLSLITEEKIKRLDVAAETARLYLISLANQTRLTNADKTYDLANETVAAVKKRVVAGKAPEAELARARVDLERKRLDREYLEYQFKSAIHILAAQWGEMDPEFTAIDGDIFILPSPSPFSTLKSRFEKSPGFLRLLSDKRLKQTQLKLAKFQGNPLWKVNLGLRHFATSNDQALVVGINIPFGERARNTGRIAAAREILLQNQSQQDELRVRMESMLFMLSQELRHSLHRADTYQKIIIPQLESALMQTRRAYELGRYSYLEWRSVQAELLDARTSSIEDSIDAHLKIIEIERLTGISMQQPADNKKREQL